MSKNNKKRLSDVEIGKTFKGNDGVRVVCILKSDIFVSYD